MSSTLNPEVDPRGDHDATAGAPDFAGGPNGPPSAARRRLVRFWSGVSQATVFAVMSLLLWWLFAWALAEQAWVENQLMWTVCSLFPAVVATSFLLLHVSRKRPAALVGLPLDATALRDGGAGFALSAGMALGIVGVQYAAGWVTFQEAELFLQNYDGGFVWTPPLWLGAGVLALGSSAEELLFRGYGLQQLMRATNPWIAVSGTSVLFGIMHGGNPDASEIGIANTVLFGALFGFALVRRRSLWLPLGLHFGWNGTLATIGANVSGLKIKLAGFALVPEGPELWSGASYGPEASLLTSFAVLAVGFVIWKMPAPAQSPRLWD